MMNISVVVKFIHLLQKYKNYLSNDIIRFLLF